MLSGIGGSGSQGMLDWSMPCGSSTAGSAFFVRPFAARAAGMSRAITDGGPSRCTLSASYWYTTNWRRSISSSLRAASAPSRSPSARASADVLSDSARLRASSSGASTCTSGCWVDWELRTRNGDTVICTATPASHTGSPRAVWW